TTDIEDLKFNTAIVALMTLLNEIEAKGSITKDELAIFIRLLSPFAPHLCEEIWESLGEKTLLSLSKWPEYDEAKTVDATIEIAVQISGKLKGTVVIAADADKDTAIAAAKADEKIASLLEGKNIIKEIYVPGKIVNIVAK
ncbi:MAG: class I tRNA ligase family protein, partial [Clostridia bacterium]|nr:class I tRNA ligase family protein [Clostridia bacterium]